MKQKAYVIILVICLLSALLPAGISASEPADAADLVINTAAELAEFRDSVNEGDNYSGQMVKLGSDIDLNGSQQDSWMPIGTEPSNYFNGVFDGCGYKISGIYLNSASNAMAAFFRGIGEEGVVKNLMAKGVMLAANTAENKSSGGIAAENYGTIENCLSDIVISVNVPNKIMYIGGIAGSNSGVIKNCCQVNSIFNAYDPDNIGGIVGRNVDTGSVQNCYYNSARCGSNEIEGAEGKTTEQMKSGEVAYLLRTGQEDLQSDDPVWGQNTTADPKDEFPVLTTDATKAVYKVTFVANDGEYAAGYTNHGRTTALPEPPEIENGVLAYWTSDPETAQNPPQAPANVFDENTAVNGDMTVYAVSGRQFKTTGQAGIIAAQSGHTAEADLYDYVEFTNSDDKTGQFRFEANDALPPEITLDGSTVTWTPTDDTQTQIDVTFTVTDLNPYIPAARANSLSAAVGSAALTLTFVKTPDLSEYFQRDETDPYGNTYFIQNKEELETLEAGVNSGVPTIGITFIQTADIDLDGSEENIWTPIGSYDNQFQGGYDGGGYEISGLYTNGRFWQGLFGYTGAFAAIHNLSVSGSVTGVSGVGGIVGWNLGTIENCTNACVVQATQAACGGITGYNEGTIAGCLNTGDITGNSSHVGGIVGQNPGVSVTNCRNDGSVTGNASTESNAGGIAGSTTQGIIANCYNTGRIYARNQAGGVVGHAQNSVITRCYNIGNVEGTYVIGGVSGASDLDSQITDCYNAGAVSGFIGIGGIAGYIYSGAVISNCYNTGVLTAVEDDDIVVINTGGGSEEVVDTEFRYMGSIAGMIERYAFIQNCFYNEEGRDAEENRIGGVTGIPLEDFADQSIFEAAGWDFNDVWMIGIFVDRPVLREIPEDGNGSEQFAYLIPDLETLETFRDMVNGGKSFENDYIKLTDDIDIGGNAENQWTPIGADKSNSFRGNFDADGHEISGLYMDNAGASPAGLFGFVGEDGKIRNLGVAGAVTGGEFAGGVAAFNMGTLSNCYSAASVTGRIDAGGLTGHNAGIVENCYNTGIVTGTENIGGITGNNESGGTVANCYNTGTVTGESNAGNLVGLKGGTVANSYFLADEQTEPQNGETGKIQAQFESGEVAYLLQEGQADDGSGKTIQVWGQNLANEPKDTLPVLTDDSEKAVLQVTFMVDGSIYTQRYTNTNATVDLPENPELRNGFLKWSLTDNRNGEEFTSETPVTGDVTVYAIARSTSSGSLTQNVYYTVTFDTQGGSEIDSIRVRRNGTAAMPETPVREGYVFDGWYTDKECTETYDFRTPVTTNITLYAKWIEESSEQPSAWENPFTDVSESDWYYDAVQYATQNGLFSGVTENTFAPDMAITRGMMVTVLWRIENNPVVNYLMTFEDVDETAYYGEAVRWAASEEIVKGYSEAEFVPERLITREEMAAIMNRYAEFKGSESNMVGDLSQFKDESLISGWARDNVSWAVGAGFLTGKGDGILDPQGSTTRAETASILQRFLEQ